MWPHCDLEARAEVHSLTFVPLSHLKDDVTQGVVGQCSNVASDFLRFFSWLRALPVTTRHVSAS
jgi:hypothetical protein